MLHKVLGHRLEGVVRWAFAGGNSTFGRTAMKLQPRPLYPKTISRSKCGNNSPSVLARYTYYCTGVWNEMGMVEMEWWNGFFFSQYKFCIVPLFVNLILRCFSTCIMCAFQHGSSQQA